jgi:transposase
MTSYTVHLSRYEREVLKGIISKGSHPSQTFRAAYVLLNCDVGRHSKKATHSEISKVLKIGMRTIDRIKKRYIEKGLDVALERKPTSRVYDSKLGGELETKLLALLRSKPPQGYFKWSLRLLADKMVELYHLESISYETVRRVLKKASENRENPGDTRR